MKKTNKNIRVAGLLFLFTLEILVEILINNKETINLIDQKQIPLIKITLTEILKMDLDVRFSYKNWKSRDYSRKILSSSWEINIGDEVY